MRRVQRIGETVRQELLCGYKRQLIWWREKGLKRIRGFDREKLLNKDKEQGNGEWRETGGRR